MQDAYARRGFCAVSDLLTADELRLLRDDSSKLLEALTARGGDLLEEACVLDPVDSMPEGDAARTNMGAYVPSRRAQHNAASVEAFHTLLLSKLPAAVVAAGAESSAFLFNEHHVVKPRGPNTSFRWHTDAAHQLEAVLALRSAARTAADDSDTDGENELDAQAYYTSVWCALDDIDETNGTLLLLPRDAPQPSSPWHQPADVATKSWLESTGRSHAVAATVRAGDAIVFSSRLWHCSEPNVSGASRRAFYAQYAPRVIGAPAAPICLAIPTRPQLALLPPLTPIELVGLPSPESSTQYETDEAEGSGAAVGAEERADATGDEAEGGDAAAKKRRVRGGT